MGKNIEVGDDVVVVDADGVKTAGKVTRVWHEGAVRVAMTRVREDGASYIDEVDTVAVEGFDSVPSGLVCHKVSAAKESAAKSARAQKE